MAHTLPDYTDTLQADTIFGISDLGELGARLGSISTFDRRGNVIWYDDFEGGTLTWETATNVAGSAVNLASTWPMRGSQNVDLVCGAGANAYALMYKYISPSVLGKVGLEFSFTTNVQTDTWEFQFNYYDGTYRNQAYFKYLPANDKWQYLNSAGSWTDMLTSIVLEESYKTYHTVKVVMDIENNYWSRFICNQNEVDMSDQGLRRVASAIQNCLNVLIGHYSDHTSAITCYVDNVIVTQNEP